MSNGPLAQSKPPDQPTIAESTIRAIRRLPELVALVREIASGQFAPSDIHAAAVKLIAKIDEGAG